MCPTDREPNSETAPAASDPPSLLATQQILSLLLEEPGVAEEAGLTLLERFARLARRTLEVDRLLILLPVQADGPPEVDTSEREVISLRLAADSGAAASALEESHTGTTPAHRPSLELPLGTQTLATAILAGVRPLAIPDLSSAGYSPEPALALAGASSALACQVGEREGAILALSQEPCSFPEDQVELIAQLGTTLGAALEIERAKEVLRLGFDALAARTEERAKELKKTNALMRQEIQERRRIEGVLRRTSHIVASTDDSLSFIDRDLIYREANPQCCRYFRRRREEIIGTHARDLVEPDYYENEDLPRLQRCLAGEEITYRRWFGVEGHRKHCFDISLSPYREPDGEIAGIVVTARNVTEQTRAEDALRESEERFRTLADTAPVMIWMSDREGGYIYFNRPWLDFSGEPLEEQLGDGWTRGVHPEDRERREQVVAKAHGERAPYRMEYRLRRADGQYRWILDTGQPRLDASGGLEGYIGTCLDVTEAHNLSEQLSYQASHDALTGLVNRRAFEVQLEKALESSRQQQAEHALLYLDLDQFKVINDTCGHIAGDELLRQLARLLRNRVRKGDTIARLGGDEFGALIQHCSLQDAEQVAAGLREAVAEYRFVWEDKSFNLGVSIGLVPLTEGTESITSALAAADSACYAAKEKGRNRYHVYHRDDIALARRQGEMQWVSRLHRALDEDRFQLFVQPIRRLDRLESVAPRRYEILLRMEDEDGQLVVPGAFLPAAERYNLSVRIDRWVVKRALHWLEQSPDSTARLECLCLNLSGHSLSDEGFLGFLKESLESSAIQPELLCFEITETSAISNLTAASRFIRGLKDLGCRFALDDFGSGLSSFAYLKNLPVDYLKIDGIFVKDIAQQPIDFAMVKSINEIGHVMGKETIAEFVQDRNTLELLKQIGVDYAQGYAIGRPHPIDELRSETL
ncbi:MAG: EAL domain-containing protein [Acidobacteriota bacterium]